MTLDTKSKIFATSTVVIIILALVLLLLLVSSAIDSEGINAWLDQSITTLKVWELIVIVAVCSMIFGGSK